MKRLALPVVLSVVFATTGSPLFGACDGNGCRTARASNCGCQESYQPAPPVYHNTEFPGTCRECKDNFAFSLWADYCQTKRSGPAYRLPRRPSCIQCGPNLGEACGAGCDPGHAVVGEHGYAPEGSSHQQVHAYPTPAAAKAPSSVQSTDAVDANSEAVEPEVVGELPAAPEAPSPRETTYFGAPRSDNSEAVEDAAATRGAVAEVDESTMPTEPGSASDELPAGQETEDAIRRSVDDAIERALEAGSGDAPSGTNDALDDRSAKHRPSFFRIFRPRNR